MVRRSGLARDREQPPEEEKEEEDDEPGLSVASYHTICSV